MQFVPGMCVKSCFLVCFLVFFGGGVVSLLRDRWAVCGTEREGVQVLWGCECSARARQTRDSPLLWPVLTQRIVLRDARYCSVLGDARY